MSTATRSLSALRTFVIIVVLNSVFGLFAYPLFTSNTTLYLVAWLNNLFVGMAAIVLALKAPTILPRARRTVLRVIWIEFWLLTFISLYELALKWPSLEKEMWFAHIVALLVSTGIWYVVASSIASIVDRHSSGTFSYSALERIGAWCMLVACCLIVALGVIGLSA